MEDSINYDEMVIANIVSELYKDKSRIKSDMDFAIKEHEKKLAFMQGQFQGLETAIMIINHCPDLKPE